MAILAFPTVFYADFNQLLYRFIPTVEEQEKNSLFLITVISKTLILAAVMSLAAVVFLVFPRAMFWNDQLVVDSIDLHRIFIILLVLIPFLLINNSMQAYSGGMKKIFEVQKLSLFARFLEILSFLFISVTITDRVRGLEFYVVSRLMITGLSIGLWSYFLNRWTGLLGVYRQVGVLPSLWRKYYHEFFKSYTFPMIGASISAYAKEYLAPIFLGETGNYAEASYYEVVRQLFAYPRKLFPTFSIVFLPHAVTTIERNTEQFCRHYIRFGWVVVGIYLSIASVFLFLDDVWLSWYNIESSTPGVTAIVYMFSVNLSISGFALVGDYAIQLNKKTIARLYASFSRCIVHTSLLVYLLPQFGGAGAAASLLGGTVIATMITELFALKTSFRRESASLAQICAILLIQLFLYSLCF